MTVGIYAGTDYPDGDVTIGAPDVGAVRQGQKAFNWDPSIDPSMGRWLDAAVERDDVLYFSIYHQNALVGQILLHDIDRSSGDSLVGYHIFEPRHRGMGIGTTALRLLQRFVLEERSLTRLVAITSSDNTASRRIAEKCGFIYVGAPREDPTGVLMTWQVLDHE